MKTVTRMLSLAALVLAPLGAAHAAPATDALQCGVIDPASFVSYVQANKPTLVELKGQINCLQVVTPDEVTTRELRYNNSRFFAEMDEHGRIVGGRFG